MSGGRGPNISSAKHPIRTFRATRVRRSRTDTRTRHRGTCTICVAVAVERELSHPRHNMCHARAVPHSHTPARSVVCAVQYCRPGGTSPYPPPRAVSPSRFPGGVSTCRAPSSSRGGESVDMRVACAGGDISHTTTSCCLGYSPPMFLPRVNTPCRRRTAAVSPTVSRTHKSNLSTVAGYRKEASRGHAESRVERSCEGPRPAAGGDKTVGETV